MSVAGALEQMPQIDCSVDDEARLNWCTLYSASLQGKMEAVSIAQTLLNAASGGFRFGNPSAFVVASTRNKWHLIQDDAGRTQEGAY